MFEFLKNKEERIVESMQKGLDGHLLYMMNKTPLNQVIRRNEQAKSAIEDRLGSAFLEHYSVCFLVWMGNRGDKLQAAIIGRYRQRIIDMINDCASFSPTDYKKMEQEFGEDLAAADGDEFRKNARIGRFMLDISKEKCREWFVSYLDNNYGATASEQVTIGATLLGELDFIWSESAKLVEDYLS